MIPTIELRMLMKRNQAFIALGLGALCVIGAGIFTFFLYARRVPVFFLYPDKTTFYHHQFVTIHATVKYRYWGKGITDSTSWEKKDIPCVITQDNTPVSTIGSRTQFNLHYNARQKIWSGTWPCPWNIPPGSFKPIIPIDDIAYHSIKFSIKSKPLYAIDKGLGVMTFETNSPLRSMHPPLINTSTGEKGNWRNLYDWCEFTGVDAFWVLGGQTAYFNTPLKPDFPWLDYNIPFFSEMGKEAHSRGLKFGVYVMDYLTFGNTEFAPPQYTYAIDYNAKTGELFKTRSISLNDLQRRNDIIALMKRLHDIPEVDYVGMDYIRNALGGMELVDDFVREMDVAVPAGWEQYSKETRMKWLGRHRASRSDMDFIDQWQWWRAHRSASIVEEIKNTVKSEKPLWVFTLSWERGWQHGQDPVMMADAGADIDAVMLYEITAGDYGDILTHWRTYLSTHEANIIAGDVIDWNLHEKTLNPAGPEEYLRRNSVVINQFYKNGPTKGVFIHDLGRLLWGRRGPYSRIEWALAGAASVSLSKDMYKQNACTAVIELPEHAALHQEFSATISVQIHRVISSTIAGTVFTSEGLQANVRAWQIDPGAHDRINKSINLTADYFNSERGGRHFMAVRLAWLEGNRKKSYSTIAYCSINAPNPVGAGTPVAGEDGGISAVAPVAQPHENAPPDDTAPNNKTAGEE
jgi:hypothetical protein